MRNRNGRTGRARADGLLTTTELCEAVGMPRGSLTLFATKAGVSPVRTEVDPKTGGATRLWERSAVEEIRTVWKNRRVGAGR